ncbi:MAG: class D sortase [Clostridiales bacterium]|nr:class D sortase [Candidatus Equinaster intestinalis]
MKTSKKILIALSPIILAILGYLIIFFAARPLISSAASIIDMISGGAKGKTEFNNMYNGNVFKTYTETIPSSEVEFPLPNTQYGEITIEGTDVNCPLIYGDSTAMLKKGACQYMGSSFPGFGSTLLVSGHNNSYFKSLKDAKIGAIITVKTTYGEYKYKIVNTAIKQNTDESAYDLTADKENVVFYTCYPFDALGLTYQRYFVYGEYVSGPKIIFEDEE